MTKIVWKQPIIEDKDFKDTTFVNMIFVDSFSEIVKISFEQAGTMKTKQVSMTMEHAQQIGFINFDKLKQYSF